MRILSSGLLLGGGGIAIAYGMINRADAISINAPIITGLAMMSLGLFALRVNAEDPEDEQGYNPVEYRPPN